MPSKLLQRLERFLDQQHAHTVMALEHEPREVDKLVDPPKQDPAQPNKPATNTKRHWPKGNFGDVIRSVQQVVIHGTSGWPSYNSAENFVNVFSSIDSPAWNKHKAQWSFRHGYGPQYFVDPNGTAFTLIGPKDLAGAPRLTWHMINMNSFSLGIENGDAGDSGAAPGNGLGPRWWRLSNESEDLAGMKAYVLLHPDNNQDAVLIWVAQFPQFAGSGDIEDGKNPATDRHLNRSKYTNWRNTLFTERNYRSLVLLSRLLAEQNGLPRNFPLLPYLDNDTDAERAALFRQLILSDQRCDQIVKKLRTTTAVITTDLIRTHAPEFTAWYESKTKRDSNGKFISNAAWSRLFGLNPADIGTADLPCFRGFISHDINGHHPCPGPLFDWYRFAREVWDWWWYPFDVDRMGVTPTPRSYFQARRDTQLIDYYYDATGTADDYNQLHAPMSITEKFVLPDARTPIYAMANGVVVAARFALNNNLVDSGFLLVRHEVFNQGWANRIDYDIAPTVVWSLISFLENAGFSIPEPPPAFADATPAANPTWLNRFIMRLRECELAVAFHTATLANPSKNPAQQNLRTALNRGWIHNPSGSGPRISTGQEIERDATAYRALANDLLAGRHVLFPLEKDLAPTPVRVILGDFLGFPNRMIKAQSGIQIEIFSKERLDVPGVTFRACSASTEDWWKPASDAKRHEANVGMDLPQDGMAWHYPMTDFLKWINHITWASEWQKYGVVGPDGVPADVPERPVTRRVS